MNNFLSRKSRLLSPWLSYIVLSIVMCALQAPSYAFSVSNIPGITACPQNIQLLTQRIRHDAEPYCTQWHHQWPYSIPRDSIKSLLHHTLALIDTSVVDTHQLQKSLLCATVWHYLYQLEEDGAFKKADSIATWTQTRYPTCANAAWLKGVNLVKAAHLQRGFYILDSLRNTMASSCQDFLKEYADLSATCFLPQNLQDSEISISTHCAPTSCQPFLLLQSEYSPDLQKWQVCSSPQQPRDIPAFTFTAEYSLGKQFNIQLPLLHHGNDILCTMIIRPDIANDIPEELVHIPQYLKYPARIEISAGPVASTQTLTECIYELVANRFDIVRREQDLAKLGAISLRCHTNSAFDNVSGYEYALIAFDSHIQVTSHDSFYLSSTTKQPEDLHVRYVITMTTRSAVKDKAEVLLQDIVKKFETFQL